MEARYRCSDIEVWRSGDLEVRCRRAEYRALEARCRHADVEVWRTGSALQV